jgi:hypothetical protein
MDRREFAVGAAWALLGGAAITIGCGGGTSPTESTPPVTDSAGSINSNHGHSATITAAQLLAGGALQLDIRGTAGHTHSVALTAAEVVSIRNGSVIVTETSKTSHSHTVTFNG